jgi:hypothetical protein
VGVPLIIPVLAARLKPAGKVPVTMDQLKGVVPPVETRVWLYPPPTVPAGKVVVVTTGAALVTIDNA